MALDVTDIICKENMEAVSSLKNKPNMHWSQSTAFIKDLLIKVKQKFQVFREAKKATQNQAAERFKIKTAASQMV